MRSIIISPLSFPAEEGPLPGGSKKIIETHLIDDIDAFFAYHVTNKLTSDSIGIKVGAACAAPDLFDLTITGKGLHVRRLTLERGEVDIDGTFDELKYSDPHTMNDTKSFLGRLFQ